MTNQRNIFTVCFAYFSARTHTHTTNNPRAHHHPQAKNGNTIFFSQFFSVLKTLFIRYFNAIWQDVKRTSSALTSWFGVGLYANRTKITYIMPRRNYNVETILFFPTNARARYTIEGICDMILMMSGCLVLAACLPACCLFVRIVMCAVVVSKQGSHLQENISFFVRRRRIYPVCVRVTKRRMCVRRQRDIMCTKLWCVW